MRKSIDKVLEYLLIGLMAIMVVNVVWQVSSRYLLGDSSSFTEELARFLLIWLGLLGAGYATGQRMHLAIDLLPSTLTGQKARSLNIVIQSLVAAFGIGVMFIGGIQLVSLTFALGQTSAALSLPLGYVYLVMPLSGLLIAYYSIANIFEFQPPVEVH